MGWAYELTGDWSDPSGWKRISLVSGFTANSYLFGNSMTWGKQRLFYPSEQYRSTPNELGNMPKPWIALSGDDDGIHYILYPVSEELDNWEYEIQVMVDTEATTTGTDTQRSSQRDTPRGWSTSTPSLLRYTQGMVH